MPTYPLFVTCPRGLEAPLSAELQAAGAADIRPAAGGVSCSGTPETIYRINLHARTAGRVLLQIAAGKFRDTDDIARIAQKAPWARFFTPEHTFKIHIEGRKAGVTSLNFAAMKVKDGLCDAFREATGRRPSVDKHAADMRVSVFIDEQHISIYLDTSGEALFKRGYRKETGSAPIRENLAAGLLLLAGYDGTKPFSDPFCGSGTIAIEAALIACNRAPGLARRFAFEKFNGFDAPLWGKLKAEAEENTLPAAAPISGSDHDAEAVRQAAANAAAAGVAGFITWQTASAADCRPNGENGILISNPPYGVRLEEVRSLGALYPQLGTLFKQYFAGWRVGMFTADREMPKLMRLKPGKKYPLFNGNLDCRLFVFDMVAGSNRREK